MAMWKTSLLLIGAFCFASSGFALVPEDDPGKTAAVAKTTSSKTAKPDVKLTTEDEPGKVAPMREVRPSKPSR